MIPNNVDSSQNKTILNPHHKKNWCDSELIKSISYKRTGLKRNTQKKVVKEKTNRCDSEQCWFIAKWNDAKP
jgi:hypothetical protein